MTSIKWICVAVVLVLGFYWGLSTFKSPLSASAKIPLGVQATPPPLAVAKISPLPQTLPSSGGLQAKVEAARKIAILKDIFKSKNDNDPRLDTEFNSLSEESKQALREEYASLRPEAKNERGTLVFLIGKNLSSPQDFAFLGNVMKEEPCLSLANCKHSGGDVNSHENNGVEITLEYSQIVANKALEHFLKEHPNDPRALKVLHEAEHSKNHLARRMAHDIIYAPRL